MIIWMHNKCDDHFQSKAQIRNGEQATASQKQLQTFSYISKSMMFVTTCAEPDIPLEKK